MCSQGCNEPEDVRSDGAGMNGATDANQDPLRSRRTPLEIDADEFARIGHRLVDDLAGLIRGLSERPLTPGEGVEDVRAALRADASLPEEGMDAAGLLAEATEFLLDHSLYNGHPRFFGYVPAAAGPVGVLGELLAATINPNVGAWVLSPAATEIERQTVRWIAEFVGFPGTGDGIMVSGGNMANMLGFWAARIAGAGRDLRTAGLCTEGAPRLRAYASPDTHTWIHKIADLSGLGLDGVRRVDTDGQGRMVVEALRSQIEADVTAGDRPFLVVGTAGTVGTGAVDRLPALRALCDEMGLWLHVDGAYGGFAAAVPEHVPDDLLGLGLADSLAVDPHKWLYAPLEVGCTLVRNPQALVAAFGYRPEYYNFEAEATNYFERGIQNSRGFRALKVWLQLRHAGRAGYRRMIAEDIELARRFHALADRHPELEAWTRGLSITTYRYVPEELAGRTDEPDVAAYLDELNRAVQTRMETSGLAFVSNAVVEGRYLLRMCVVNFRTRLQDVEALVEVSVRLGRELHRETRRPPLE